MAHRLQASPHPDASRAQPVFTACQPCTAGRHPHPAALTSCERLFNPQTIQPPPATRARPLLIVCRPGWPRPQVALSSPRKGPLSCRLVNHTRDAPQACPRPPQGPARGSAGGGMGGTLPARARGTPSHHATPKGLGHHIARPEIDLRRADGRGMGKARAVLWQPPAVEEGPRQRFRGRCWGLWGSWASSCEMTGGSLERNLKGDFEIDSGGVFGIGPTCAQVLRSQADKALHHWVCPPQRWVVEPGQHLGVSPVPTP